MHGAAGEARWDGEEATAIVELKGDFDVELDLTDNTRCPVSGLEMQATFEPARRKHKVQNSTLPPTTIPRLTPESG